MTELVMKRLYTCGLCLALVACQGLQPSKVPNEAKAALATVPVAKTVPAEIPDSVTQDLLALSSPSAGATVISPRFNVAAVNVDVADFFPSLVADTDFSVALHPDVKGVITLDLKQVTLTEAFQVVEQLYGFHIERIGSIYKVLPAGMRTETFAVNYLLMQRSGSSSLSVTAGGISSQNGGNSGNSGSNRSSSSQTQGSLQNGNFNSSTQSSSMGSGTGSSIQSSNQTDFWKDIKEAITGIIGSGEDRAVVVSPQAGLVTVRAMPAEIAAVRSYLGQAEESLQRQVILEAKIIEVTLNDDYKQGINWQQIAGSIGKVDIDIATPSFSFGNDETGLVGGSASVNFSGTDFTGVIHLLETQGNAQVLSSPRVTAINNQKAVIKVGTDEYFAIGVNPAITTTGSGDNAVSQSTPEYSPIFSGIALDVTPQISQSGEVILHVHPSVSETVAVKKPSGGAEPLDFALTNVRESDTIIKARNGEIVVIGGLMQSALTDTESKVPVIGSVPLVGKLFTNTSKVEKKKELIILIKPTVVGAGVMQQQMLQSSELLEQWYPKKN